jgi:PAS domain S-box-containing protein
MSMSSRPGNQDQPNRGRRPSFPHLNPNPIVGVDSSGRITFLNNGAVCALECIGKDASPEVFLPKDMDEILAALKRRERATFRREVTVGDWVFDEHIYVAPEHGSVGIYAADITERKHAEEALRESESRFRQLSNSLPQLVWTCLPDGPCDYLSKQWLEYTGIPAERQLGFGWLEQLHPDDREPTVTAWNAAVASDSDFHIEFRIRGHDGEYRWFDTHAVRLCDARGRTVKWLGSSTDITEHKQTEERRERLTRTLSQNNEELRQLIYAASHDLRTPMVGVQGFVSELRIALDELAKVLREPGVPPAVIERTAALVEKDIPESLKFVEAGMTRMSVLLSGLLRLARLDRAALAIEELDMNRVAGEVLAAAEFQAKEAGAQFEVARLPSCFGDGVLTGRLLANLIDNAIKYRDPTRPLVVRVSGARARTESVYCVADNGIGIAPGLRARVFELFYRVAPKQGSGDGLGLTIIKRIADRLGGRVWVESEPDNGTRFFFALPASRPAV